MNERMKGRLYDWIAERLNERIREWVNERMKEWKNGWMCKCVNERMKEWKGNFMTELVSDRMKEWVKERMEEWLNEWMKYRLHDRMKEATPLPPVRPPPHAPLAGSRWPVCCSRARCWCWWPATDCCCSSWSRRWRRAGRRPSGSGCTAWQQTWALPRACRRRWAWPSRRRVRTWITCWSLTTLVRGTLVAVAAPELALVTQISDTSNNKGVSIDVGTQRDICGLVFVLFLPVLSLIFVLSLFKIPITALYSVSLSLWWKPCQSHPR